MKTFKILLTVIATALLFASCEKDNSKIGIIDFKNSDCNKKSNQLEDVESITFKAINNKQLHVIHTNAIFNCCPGKLFAECNLEGDTISIKEQETEHTCDCICPYKLEYTIDNLPSKAYQIKLQDNFLLQLNFNSNTDTTIILNN